MILAVAIVAALVAAPTVDAEGCRTATSAYNSALSDVSYALRRYSTCVADSQGTDDCSTEFRRLKNAQSDFESAVTTYGYECN